MIKNIIKELIIIILLLLAVCIILGILFYDYIPMNKTVPLKLEPYQISNEVTEELSTELSDENETIIKTYTIDSTDLDYYESINDYDKGKQNPFAIEDEKEENNIESNNINNSTEEEPEPTLK